jgi:cobalt-zinc-cadmium efflux system protein
MSEQKPLAPIHHVHTHDHSNKNLKTAFILNLAFTLLEIVGGLYVIG